jgi:hypothetical protein
VYIGSYDNVLYSINSGGGLSWSYGTSDWIFSSPAIGPDGQIYVGSTDYYIYALTSNGNFRWRYPTGNSIYSSPAIGSDGMAYIGSGDSRIYAVASNGDFAWTYTAGEMVVSSPAIGSDGRVYTGSHDNNICVFMQAPTPTQSPAPTVSPTATPIPTSTPLFFVPLNIRLGQDVQPPAGILSIFSDITVEDTPYAGVPCLPYLAVSVGDTMYYIVSGNRITTKQTPYLSNGKSKYFRLYGNITDYNAAVIPFSDLAPGRYWVYGALLDETGAPLGPIAERVITIE